MKKILIYFACIQVIAFCLSCKKEVAEYNGREGVYFAVQHGNPGNLERSWPYQPYSDVDFVRLGVDTVSFPVKVMITGPVKNYDRTFRVEINPDSTTAVLGGNYEAVKSEWTIPAGAVSTIIKIRVKRTPDLQIAKRTLGLRLVPTGHFSLSFPEWDAIPTLNGGPIVPKFDASLHTLRINDIMVRPAVWSGSIQAGNREAGILGAFTRKKMEFLIQHLGLTYEDFASAATMPSVRLIVISNDAAAILIKRKNAGNPILEDDGRLMFIGPVPWTSFIGIPWVPGT